MTTYADTTLLARSEPSPYATENFVGSVPFDRVEALFDFDVEYAETFHRKGDAFLRIPNRQAVRRTDNDRVFNIVSHSHGLHQFRDALIGNVSLLLDTAAGDLKIVGAGLLEHGAVGWVQIEAPSMWIAGDEVAPTITVASSHNGKYATTYRTGMFRFMCSNQLGALRKAGKDVVKIRHTVKSGLRVAEARATLDLTLNAADDFAREAQALIDTTITDAEWDRIVARLNPRPQPTNGEPPAPAAVTRWENREGALRSMYRNDPRVAPFTGTAWGAVQTFSTYREHERPVTENTRTGRTSRLGRTMNSVIGGRFAADDLNIVNTVRAISVGV